MLRSFFKRDQEPERNSPTVLSGPRIPRHSSAWSAMLKHLKEEESLRVLDIGPTSPQNINFVTGLGHSIYMGDVVHESLTGAPDGSWLLPPEEEGGKPRFNVEGFFEQNLNFGGRQFDVVLLWTTLDYIPEGLIEPLVAHLHSAVSKGGRILALFHSKMAGATAYCRYHLTDNDTIEMQETEPHPIQRVYTNRSIEKLFSKFSNYRFFLAKDNLYEVIITR
ncbi:methyltransferase domain-containing protein [Silvibacterium sp.]|uniref:methyltransferase domain-containing protein n=1 Tax=Silvibacterium sp. TaxID=1964179 RepID=UPI0039E453D1